MATWSRKKKEQSGMHQEYMLRPGERANLTERDTLPDEPGLRKRQARALLAEMRPRMNELQELLYANRQHALLIVLQGMDTAGKDGVIKHVVGAFNPQGCQVASFKVPTPLELAHDFLWRVHRVTPPKGMVGIFNRSHYEDVVVVRVDELAPPEVWEQRYEQINEFEQLLAESGTVILKFYLHISHEEQRERLAERLADPTAYWKFNPGDLEARDKWDDYIAAYEDALQRCNSAQAPWYIVPADKKWYRNLVISRIIQERLEALEMQWPPLVDEWREITID
jgi:PPK2 family polyphosphate:nucleotide phosphotransferase